MYHTMFHCIKSSTVKGIFWSSSTFSYLRYLPQKCSSSKLQYKSYKDVNEALEHVTSPKAMKVYTDGSYVKADGNERSSWGVYFGENDLRNGYGLITKEKEKEKEPLSSSDAEYKAVIKALEAINTSEVGKYEILTDNLSCGVLFWCFYKPWISQKSHIAKKLPRKSRNSFVTIFEKTNEVTKKGSEVSIIYVPGHRQIAGNDAAHRLALEGRK